jgi:hypothetical protein
MDRKENNQAWIEALKETGISTIEFDLVRNKLKLKFHNAGLYNKFSKQVEDICSSYASMSEQTFDIRLNINLIGLLVDEISELEIPYLEVVNKFRRTPIRFEDNVATVDLQAGIINVEITEIEGETREGDTYWIKNP